MVNHNITDPNLNLEVPTTAMHQDDLSDHTLSSVQQWQTLVEHSPDIIARFDKAHNHLFINKSIETVLTVKAQDCIGKSLQQAGYPENVCFTWNQYLEKVFASGKRHDLHVSIPQPEGIAYYFIIMVPEFNAQNQVETVMSIMRDVTRRKEAEQKLIDSRHMVQQIADATPDIIFVYNLITRSIEFITRNVHQKLGYPYSLFFEDDTDLIDLLSHKEDRPRLEGFFDSFKESAGKEIKEIEFRVVSAQEKQYHYRNRATVFKKDSSGQPVSVVVIAQDITAHKQAAQEVRDKKKILENILRNFPVILCRIDALGMVLQLEGAGLERYGISGKQWVGKSIFDHYPLASDQMVKVLDGKTISFTQEVFLNNKHYFLFSYYYYDAEQDCAVGFSIDITQQKDAEEAFEKVTRQNRELKRINEVMDTFVYTAAHDLKSPVSNLKLILELLQESNKEEEKQNYLKGLQTAVRRLEQTINGLVEVVEVQSSEDSVGRPLYFANILQTVMDEFTDKIKETNTTITADFDDCKQIVYIESYITSIFRNLISNAIKYRNIQRPLVISIKAQKQFDHIVVVIQDNGIGIDLAKYGKYLFKPFKRFSKQAEGSGIGLHLIKSMIEKNGGDIKVSSQPDQGVTFTLFLKEYEHTGNKSFTGS